MYTVYVYVLDTLADSLTVDLTGKLCRGYRNDTWFHFIALPKNCCNRNDSNPFVMASYDCPFYIHIV